MNLNVSLFLIKQKVQSKVFPFLKDFDNKEIDFFPHLLFFPYIDNGPTVQYPHHMFPYILPTLSTIVHICMYT